MSATPVDSQRFTLCVLPIGAQRQRFLAVPKEIDILTEKLKKLMAEEFNARKTYEDYLSNITD
ncbi:MAG TPA: hypothetical protein VG122_25455 [Gemmata sp.]|jgi:hypothetical protein|nr:hypothetical protein [Gemmata sp.]